MVDQNPNEYRVVELYCIAIYSGILYNIGNICREEI